MSAAWTATVLTLFPEMFPGPLGHATTQPRAWQTPEQPLRAGAHLAGAVAATARRWLPVDDADALAGLRQFGVDALDVRLFDRDLAGDLVGQFVDLAGRTSLNRAHAVLPLAVLAHRAARG